MSLFRPRRHPREFGLTASDRAFEVDRKFGPERAAELLALLNGVSDPQEHVLGAIVFLATTADELRDLVALAHDDRAALLNAATVKKERG
jgi:hypothetical protein